MSLKHEFAIIEKNTNIDELVEMLDKVEVDDNLFTYINDSLCWLETYWNNSRLKKQGMNYYGYTIMEGESILSLKIIINSWKLLFCNAPKDFFLTGSFIQEEDKYEKIFWSKSEILNQFEDLLKLCNEAINNKKNIIHIGI